MAKHKTAAQVTIASIQKDSTFNQFVDRNWKLGVGLAVVGTIAILVPTYLRRQARATHNTTWDDLRAQADLGSGIFAQVRGGSPESLSLFAEQHRNSPVGAWAKALEIGGDVQSEKLSEAEKAAGQLASQWPDHFLSTARIYPGRDGKERTLGEEIRDGNAALMAWEKEHAFLFTNPALPADAPKVRLNTNKGAIVVGLYVDRTPRHCENFLKLCREGYYNGTKFHKIVRNSFIQGGDPNTKAGEPESWGLGGPETTIEPENDPQLRHFRGALVAWKQPGQVNSHGSQFSILTADQNDLDGKSVVFGRLLEGESVVETIASGAVVDDRPQDPAVIESVDIL